jgi:hypothetical protein
MTQPTRVEHQGARARVIGLPVAIVLALGGCSTSGGAGPTAPRDAGASEAATVESGTLSMDGGDSTHDASTSSDSGTSSGKDVEVDAIPPGPDAAASCVPFTDIVNGQEWPDVCEFLASSPIYRSLPDNPQHLFANQEQMIATLFPSTSVTVGTQVVFDTSLEDCQYNCDVGTPLYLASASDPAITFSAQNCGEDVDDTTFCTGGLYLPISVQGHIPAMAGIEPASDGHITVVQPDGSTFEGWECGPKGHTWADGDEMSCSTMARSNLTTGTGIVNGSATSGNSSIIEAPTVRQLQQGIPRAMKIQTACVAGDVVFPGTSQAAVCSDSMTAPPIGARIQVIDTPGQIAALGLPPMETNVLVAGHVYGFVLWDTYDTSGPGRGFNFGMESAIQFSSFGQTPPAEGLVQTAPGWTENDPAQDSWTLNFEPFPDGWANHLRIVDPCYSALDQPCTQ